LTIRTRNREDGVIGIALSAALGFASGLVVGMFVGEAAGDVNSERVRGAVRRLRGGRTPPAEPSIIAQAVRHALRDHHATSHLAITVHAPGPGLIELSGLVSDAIARREAGDVARGVPGADVVVNRILVNGSDLPPQPVLNSS